MGATSRWFAQVKDALSDLSRSLSMQYFRWWSCVRDLCVSAADGYFQSVAHAPRLFSPTALLDSPALGSPDLNRGHDKSLSFNLDVKTGEWKAEFVRYRYKRDTELVVGCAGSVRSFVFCSVRCVNVWQHPLLPSVADVMPQEPALVADELLANGVCWRAVPAGGTKSSSRRRRGGMRSYGAERAATVPFRRNPSASSWGAPIRRTGTRSRTAHTTKRRPSISWRTTCCRHPITRRCRIAFRLKMLSG